MRCPVAFCRPSDTPAATAAFLGRFLALPPPKEVRRERYASKLTRGRDNGQIAISRLSGLTRGAGHNRFRL